jgi:hypothetical protein
MFEHYPYEALAIIPLTKTRRPYQREKKSTWIQNSLLERTPEGRYCTLNEDFTDDETTLHRFFPTTKYQIIFNEKSIYSNQRDFI